MSCCKKPQANNIRAPEFKPQESICEDVSQENQDVSLLEDTPPKTENYGAIPTPRNSEFVFISTKSGIPQLYLGSLQSSADTSKRLTFFPNGIERGGGSDLQVNNSGDIFYNCKYEAVGKVSLTTQAEPICRSGPDDTMYLFGPFLANNDSDENQYYYEVRHRSKPGFHLYRDIHNQGIEHDPVLVYHDASLNGWLRDIDPNGQFALVVDMKSHTNWALVLIDFLRKERKDIYPKSNSPVKVSSTKFSQNGKNIFLGTDDGQDKSVFVNIETETGEEVCRYREELYPTAEIVDIAESQDGQMVVLTLSAGSFNVLRVLNKNSCESAEKAPLNLPLGIGHVKFFVDPDKTFVFEWVTPNLDRNLYLADLDLGSYRPLIDRPGEPVQNKGVDVSVAYIESFDKIKIPINIYRPRHTATRPSPVVVYLRTGPGSVAKLRRTTMTGYFIERGYSVVEPNIRGSAGHGIGYQRLDDHEKRVDSFRDIEAVAKWLATQDWVDSKRMLIAGSSYGGYLALMGLALQPAIWRAGVDFYGITDWRSFYDTTNPGTASVYAREVGSIKDSAAFLDSISPQQIVSKMKAPIFIYHGMKDNQVAISQSKVFIEKARKSGLKIMSFLAPNEGHGLRSPATRRALFARLDCFFEETIEEDGSVQF
ncbi:MAG: prolyl oligopeptidase family serine peptidase [Myxococcota bacterium]|nr:prolyl oligopeptidase family serine peptidase [Myxococcota bacterium]